MSELPVPVGYETEALRDLAKTVRERLQKGERDDELLDGREYNFTPWRQAYTALDEMVARVAGLEARDARLRRAAGRVIARHDRGCGVIHGNKPKGYTCIDRRDEAREHPDRFMPEYAVRVGSGEELCDVCTLRAALADSGEAGS